MTDNVGWKAQKRNDEQLSAQLEPRAAGNGIQQLLAQHLRPGMNGESHNNGSG